MAKAPNLMVRSLVATGGLLLLTVIRVGFSSRGGGPARSALRELILTSVVIAVGGLLTGLILHWGWPRTRSRAAGALVGIVAATVLLGIGGLALGLWHALPSTVMIGAVLGGGLMVGGSIGAWRWPPRGSQRLSRADLIVGREHGPGPR